MTLGMYHERESLGNRRYRHTQHLKPIAYLEDGIYRLTDRNVVAYADGDYYHAVLTANMGVRIGDDGRYAAHPTRDMDRYVAFGGPVVKVGGVWTSVGFADPERIGQSVLWARPQADLTLTHLGHGLKEEIALKSGYEPEDGLIAFPVDLVGLTWDAETRALLADGEPVAWIREPYVYDADNQDDTRPITWELHSIAGQVYVLFHLPDLAGMASPIIDPTLTLQPDAAAGQDTSVRSNFPTRNLGVTAELYSYLDIFKGLIRFDVSALPAEATVTSAIMSLYHADNPGVSVADSQIDVYEVAVANGDWIEGTQDNVQALAGEPCWDAKEADGAGGVTTAWAGSAGLSTAGTDYVNVIIGTFTNANPIVQGAEVTATLTNAVVQGWIASNPGMVLIPKVVATDGIEAGASNHLTAGWRPKLVVVYTVPGGGGMLRLGVG